MDWKDKEPVIINRASFDGEHIAWMRANVRCETCRWFVGYCNCLGAPAHMLVKSCANSCTTHWEPKGGA